MHDSKKTFALPPHASKPGESHAFNKRQIPRQSGAFYA